jgi:DNA polymerase elongation subunit (family B)
LQSFGITYDPVLYGASGARNLVAVEFRETGNGKDAAALFVREGGSTVEKVEPFISFIAASDAVIGGCPVECRIAELGGAGKINRLALFESWKKCRQAKDWLAETTGVTPGAPDAPYIFYADPVHQHMLLTGRTLFQGMNFDDLRRMQIDIECLTTEGYEFCNAEREGDRIIAIAMTDGAGWSHVMSGVELDEKEMLSRMVKTIRERDPDVIEGHNIFNFDLPYIAERAKRCKVKLALGRDGSTPARRASRFSAGERTITFERFDIFGRHIVDTLFLVHAYDVTHRSLSGLGLKDAAKHFGVAAGNRTYIPGDAISAEFRRNPAAVMAYVRDDSLEAGELSRILSQSSFVQAQILPYSYQNVCVRGNATKIDAMLVREYLRQRQSLPVPGPSKEFAGGYTDMFMQGVIGNAHHCDVRSLYPSLMLTRKIGPAGDRLGVFLKLLSILKEFRLKAKAEMVKASTPAGKNHFDALQSAFKVLINSFYGYLGFAQGRFCDFDAAEKVASQGRELLAFMISWLRKRGAAPVEIDTDGIYFVPPRDTEGRSGALEKFRKEFSSALPEGIEIEFDGEFKSMYSYKMKNYALLAGDGEIIIKGAALKSRGLEPFQRSFLSELIRLKLEGREAEIPALKARYDKAISGGKMPIHELAKTETLQDTVAAYKEKIGRSSRARSALYELAMRSGRDYRPGDQLSYYVTGARKTVTVFENAKPLSGWNPDARDENKAYYLAKLDDLYGKFVEKQEQPVLNL